MGKKTRHGDQGCHRQGRSIETRNNEGQEAFGIRQPLPGLFADVCLTQGRAIGKRESHRMTVHVEKPFLQMKNKGNDVVG